MAALANNISICAAKDGLLLQPITAQGELDGKRVRIEYQTPHRIVEDGSHRDDEGDGGRTFEAHGIVGRESSSSPSRSHD